MVKFLDGATEPHWVGLSATLVQFPLFQDRYKSITVRPVSK